MTNVLDQVNGKNYTLYGGDCCQVLQGLPDSSVDFSIDSPPFSSLYIYSDSEADMGNSASIEEFLMHYEYAIKETYRVTVPGRLVAVHVKDLPLYKNAADWFGIEDFSGLVSYLHRKAGFVFHSRITIWKDPVIEMEKTNSHGLLHKNFVQRGQVSRVGLPDYLMVFVKPDPESMGKDVKHLRQIGDYIGQNPPQPHEWLNSLRQRTPDYYTGTIDQYNYSIAVWQRYASPVWFDIDQTRVLNYRIAKGNADEKHICPLQLDVIERAIDLWTNPGEVVLSKFAGIGSEPVSALKLKRKAIGIELKPEYLAIAAKNCADMEESMSMPTLFEFAGIDLD